LLKVALNTIFKFEMMTLYRLYFLLIWSESGFYLLFANGLDGEIVSMFPLLQC
jgi:hypothetical protein